MLCFVFRYSGGKTPLIIVAIMLGMIVIASLTWLHQRWIFQASPRGGAEADFEAQSHLYRYEGRSDKLDQYPALGVEASVRPR
jgi:hypothetical protein